MKNGGRFTGAFRAARRYGRRLAAKLTEPKLLEEDSNNNDSNTGANKMNVEELMTKSPACCLIDDFASEAAQVFWEKDCGCVPLVNDQGELCGIVTDRDLCMAAHFSDKKLSEIRLGDIYQGRVHTCLASQDVTEAALLMQNAQVRRIVVIDSDSKVVGILSLNDIASARIPAEDVASTLGAICAPHGRFAA